MDARSWRSSGAFFDIDHRESRAKELEQRMADPGFWDNPDGARRVVTELKSLRRVTEPYRELRREVDDAEGMATLLVEDPDESLALEPEEQSKRLLPRIQDLEIRSLLSDESDAHGAILTIHPGAGGTESQDWAEMLLRMYMRFVERRGWSAGVLDRQPGDEAGIKDATIQIDGEMAYGYLKAERGVHRLVRISPYDAQKRRHTSFASVFVYPQVSEDTEVDIKEGDLRIDTYRASGAGGQHVNKTESAVRITHLPTGVVVACQNERSQIKNRAMAMKVLKSRLYDQEVQKRQKEQDEREGKKMDNAWGSQIRSYVLHPYRLVKDHRTGAEVGDADRVLDGGVDPFIEAFLKGQMAAPGKEDVAF